MWGFVCKTYALKTVNTVDKFIVFEANWLSFLCPQQDSGMFIAGNLAIKSVLKLNSPPEAEIWFSKLHHVQKK